MKNPLCNLTMFSIKIKGCDFRVDFYKKYIKILEDYDIILG